MLTWNFRPTLPTRKAEEPSLFLQKWWYNGNFFNISLYLLKNFPNFAPTPRRLRISRRDRVKQESWLLWGVHIWNGVYLRLVLDHLKPEKFHPSKSMATIDVHGNVCITFIRWYHNLYSLDLRKWLSGKVYISFRRGVLSCSFWRERQSQGLKWWSGQQVSLHAFLFMTKSNSNSAIRETIACL